MKSLEVLGNGKITAFLVDFSASVEGRSEKVKSKHRETGISPREPGDRRTGRSKNPRGEEIGRNCSLKGTGEGKGLAGFFRGNTVF